jgi:hypothetical protein
MDKKKFTTEDCLLLMKASADLHIAQGRSTVQVLRGTRKEHTSSKCMTSTLGLCDVNAAAALTKHQLKQKVAILVAAGDLMGSPAVLSLSSPSRKEEMLAEPVIANLVIPDNGQSSVFIKALISCPGSPHQEGASSVAPIENNYVSLAFFKERNKNKQLTKMPASSRPMRDAMILLKEKGFIKEVYCHQTGSSPSSRM